MKIRGKRTLIQILAAAIQNANFGGFINGNISRAATKQVCLPGLNCYSCPGALGACPVGALQNSLMTPKFRFPAYVLGFLIFFGALFGRFICGFLCPFGLFQDLLHRIPFVKKIKKVPGDRGLRYLKYIILLVMVVILPATIKAAPFFCKYICPSGTLSGIILMAVNTKLLTQIGGLFTWKAIILATSIILSLMIYRPFCKYICPLGAFYGLFNKIAIVKLHLEPHKCIHCGACAARCKMGVDPSKNPDSAECIRCMECVDVCPHGALKPTRFLDNSTARQGQDGTD